MAGAIHYEGNTRSVLASLRPSDKAPLRQLYLEENDKLILAFVKNYFRAAADTVWKQASPRSYIRKTVGVQALFDIGRVLSSEAVQKRTVSVNFFAQRLEHARRIDFADTFFQASGTGRTRIRTTLELALGLRRRSDLDENARLRRDAAEYRRLLPA
jgi:hypothetical protein